MNRIAIAAPFFLFFYAIDISASDTNDAEISIIKDAVINSHNYSHADCPSEFASRTTIKKSTTYTSFEEWKVTCKGTENVYTVFVARLNGQISADILGSNSAPPPSESECKKLKLMLDSINRQLKVTEDLVDANQFILYKSLACK